MEFKRIYYLIKKVMICETIDIKIRKRNIEKRIIFLKQKLENNIKEMGRVIVLNSYIQDVITTPKGYSILKLSYRTFYVGRKEVKNWPKFYCVGNNQNKIKFIGVNKL